MSKFLLFFVLTTIAEVFLMKEVAERIGYINLLFMVLFTGFLGISIAKQQGKEHLLQFQREMATGNMPGHPILEGLMILVAAAVLITPGFLTDVFGFLLLVPPVRKLLSPLVAGLVKGNVSKGTGSFRFYSNMSGSSSFDSQSSFNSQSSFEEKGQAENATFDMPEDDDLK